MLDDTFQTYNGELDNENEVYDFKEKAEIIISDPSKKQEIHDWLCTEGLGCGCLTRSVECKNFHKMLPNILEMDLKENEIELFNNEWRGVAHATFSKVALYTDFEFQKVNLTNNNKGTVFGQNFPKNTNSNYLSGDFISHPSLFTQDPFVPQDNSFTNDKNINLSSIDCSNVDVIVLDSGVNKEHPDLSASVIDFDWTQLRDGEDGITGDRIFTETSLPSDYYDDSNGHGTACASLIAGKRCGMAQGAKIYALATKGLGNQGFEEIAECMAGCVAFLKAKKNNNLGLNSERPTIFSNSWGYVATFGRFFDNTLLPSLSYTPYTGFLSASDGIDLPIGYYNNGVFFRNTKVASLSNVSDIRLLSAGLIENEVAHITDENFTNPWAFRANSGDYNHGTDTVNLTRGPYHGSTEGIYFYGTQVASINAYVDQILKLGGHFLVAAGNFNEYINHNHSLEIRRNENTGAGGSPYAPRFTSFDYVNYTAWREGVDGNNEVLSGNPTFINTSLSAKRYSGLGIGAKGIGCLAFTQGISGLFNCQSNEILNSFVNNFGHQVIFRSFGSMFTLKEECGVTSPILDVSRANNTNQAWVSGYISARCGYNSDMGFNFQQIPFNEVYIDSNEDSKSKLGLSFYNHSSPFKSFNKWFSSDWNDYPAISVGDVTPVGNYNIVNNFFQSDAQSLLTYAALSSITNDVSNDPRFVTGNDNNTNYKELSNVKFVKTSYSAFGDDIDVYAPGNAAWAAHSANSSTSAPIFRASNNEEFRFFNGTSSACPIAAGCLATFLAVHPKTTNVAAKKWLIDNSLQGFILETKKYSHVQENVAQLKTSLSSFTELAYDLGALSANGNGEYPYAGLYFAAPPLSATLDFTGTLSTFNSFRPEDMTGSYSQRVALSSCSFLTNINIKNPENEGFTMSNFLSSNLGYGYGNNTIFLNEPNKERIKRSILLNHSFFGSNNRVVQAYPIRKAVFDKLRTNKVIFNGSLLNFEKPTSETPTHFGI